jgi:hypothetical protein
MRSVLYVVGGVIFSFIGFGTIYMLIWLLGG